MTVHLWSITHVGLVRRRNEDAFGATALAPSGMDGQVVAVDVDTSPVLAVVADGMGGHPCGDLASAIAVQAVLDAKPVDADSLVDAIRYANEEIVAAMSEGDGSVGMGCTIVAALIHEGGLAVANVGDSPAIEIIDTRLVQLTTDDVAGAVPGLPGVPSSSLTQSLGGGSRLEVIDVHLYEDDITGPRRVLLCSDGLTSYVPREEIAGLAVSEDGESVVRALVERSLEAGGRDNVTVVLVDALADG